MKPAFRHSPAFACKVGEKTLHSATVPKIAFHPVPIGTISTSNPMPIPCVLLQSPSRPVPAPSGIAPAPPCPPALARAFLGFLRGFPPVLVPSFFSTPTSPTSLPPGDAREGPVGAFGCCLPPLGSTRPFLGLLWAFPRPWRQVPVPLRRTSAGSGPRPTQCTPPPPQAAALPAPAASRPSGRRGKAPAAH